MTHLDLAILNGDVVLGDDVVKVNIGVSDGRVALISDAAIDADETIDATGLTVMPGVIDEHFHCFRGYGWETYEGATRAAAKGGVTTVVDMPLDKPPTLTADTLRDKLDAIRDSCHVDYACFGGYLAEDPDQMTAMADLGAAAFKLFTGGVAPPGMYPGVDEGQTLDALRRAAALGRVTTVHCENAQIVDWETERLMAAGRKDLAAWDDARPWYSEVAAAQNVALLAEVTGARVVVAHASSPQTVEAIAAARARGADAWAETCHHYLCTTKEDSVSDIRLKWNPPTRERASVDWLWRLVAGGKVHSVGSDHAPLPKTVAEDIWAQAPGSGNGVEVFFPVFATEALHRRDIPITRIARLVSSNPAHIFGLGPRKGEIALGADADFAVVETNGRRTLDARDLEYHDQEKWSPFDGYELRVYPMYTVLRGRIIYAEGEVTGQPGDGEYLSAVAPVAA
ncbi:MAG TPA: amidohydrolase family protein [Solirubrobacteraceae bacterium]|nr:amidohydrolase family protein [Solirubrobacteraceae bacterium]